MNRIRWGPVAAVGVLVLLALVLPVLGLDNPVAMDVTHRLAGPSTGHWLGQDEFGRDELARLLWGARVSLAVSGASAVSACVIGTMIGLAGGYLGPVAEFVALRGVDVILCFPPLLLALLIVTLFGPGMGTLIPVLALVFLPGFVRVVYAGVLSVRAHDYVAAMRVLGAGRSRIMWRTILPNICGPILVQLSLAAAAALILESGLSFLGLGMVPPSPSWGLMIAAGRSTMAQAPLLLLWPCLALSLTILAMNALCDALRDAVDPHGVPRRHTQVGWINALAPGLLPERTPVLAVRGLTVEIETPSGAIRPVRDLSISVGAGETVALVGESGSGKSMTGLAIMGLLPAAARVVEGGAWVEGQDVLRLPDAALRALRGRRMAMVFQDPLSSLNPVHRMGTQLVEGLRAHGRLAASAAWFRAESLLKQVGIPDPARVARAFPHEMSGGMRQRALIALAIVNNPTLLIADEPTASLDVTIQAQVLELIAALKRERGMSVLFVTHSMPVVAEIADRVVVMYAGEIVEEAPSGALFAQPLHPYTAALLRSAPDEHGALPEPIAGTVPQPHELPAGCVFAPRCGYRVDACEAGHPELTTVMPGRMTRCPRWPVLAAHNETAVPA